MRKAYFESQLKEQFHHVGKACRKEHGPRLPPYSLDHPVLELPASIQSRNPHTGMARGLLQVILDPAMWIITITEKLS